MDNRLFRKEGFEEVITRGWGEPDTQNNIMDRIANCRREIAKWKKVSDINSHERIMRLKAALELEISKLHPSRYALMSLKQQLSDAYYEEEKF